MKNVYYYYVLTIFVFGIIFLTACEQTLLDDELEPIVTEAISSSPEEIDYNISLKSARYFIESTEETKEVKSIEPLVHGDDTLMYIFNFDKGWIVISGDKRTEPVLASDEQGSLSTNELDNPGVAIWLNDQADLIMHLKEFNPAVDYNEGIELWVLIDKAAHLTEENLKKHRQMYGATTVNQKRTRYNDFLPPGYRWVKRLVSVTSTPYQVYSSKGPLLQTKWGQGAPWHTDVPYVRVNNQWGKCATGCVAVAISQILYNRHFQVNKPMGLYHTVNSTGFIWDNKNYQVNFSRANYVTNSNRWELMPQARDGFWPNYTTQNASYVGDLMADVGNRVKMKYGEQSGASTEDYAIPTFKSYSLNCNKADYNFTTVYNNLENNNPVLTSAYATKYTTGTWFWKKTHYRDGHAWVIDGYRKKKKTYTYTYEWDLVRDEYDPSYNRDDPYYWDNTLEHNLFPPDSDLYPGKIEVTEWSSSITYLLMNWGWDGRFDSGEYSTSSSSIWKGGSYNFQYKKRMFYNIR